MTKPRKRKRNNFFRAQDVVQRWLGSRTKSQQPGTQLDDDHDSVLPVLVIADVKSNYSPLYQCNEIRESDNNENFPISQWVEVCNNGRGYNQLLEAHDIADGNEEAEMEVCVGSSLDLRSHFSTRQQVHRKSSLHPKGGGWVFGHFGGVCWGGNTKKIVAGLHREVLIFISAGVDVELKAALQDEGEMRNGPELYEQPDKKVPLQGKWEWVVMKALDLGW